MHRIAPDNLQLVHRLKDSAGTGLPEYAAQRWQNAGLYMNTCMRELSVFDTTAHAALGSRDEQTQLLTGLHAYNFLLQVVTGLHSAVPGETNVQGQFKKAWEAHKESAPDRARTLEPVIAQLLSDSRTVRREYLQGIGGHSYGSLVRKLLQPAADARILFVGSGELAMSMLPLFGEWRTAVWNRRPVIANRFLNARVFAPAEHQMAARWATHMIITTPAHAEQDLFWAAAALQRKIVVAHLDRRQERPEHWAGLQATRNFYSLDDVFALRAEQSTHRVNTLARARRACAHLTERYAGAEHAELLSPRSAHQAYS